MAHRVARIPHLRYNAKIRVQLFSDRKVVNVANHTKQNNRAFVANSLDTGDIAIPFQALTAFFQLGIVMIRLFY